MAQSDFVTEFENGQTSRQFGIFRPLIAVAVLSHGDILPTVGRAWRGAQLFRPTQVFPLFSWTSARMYRSQGLHSHAVECQNTAPHGARFVKLAGRSGFGCYRAWSKVNRLSSSLREGPKNKSPRTRGDTVRESLCQK